MGAEVLVTHKAGTGKDDALDVGFVHHGSRGVDKRLNRGWLRAFDGGGHAINNGGGAEGVVGNQDERGWHGSGGGGEKFRCGE